MTRPKPVEARVSLIINATPEEVFSAFIEPKQLVRFWLAASSGKLSIGKTVHWEFKVPGATVETTATKLRLGRAIAWKWSDGTAVNIELEDLDKGTAITVINSGFQGSPTKKIESALNATEGFSYVLADLKTLLESGKSSHIVKDKARLIELRN